MRYKKMAQKLLLLVMLLFSTQISAGKAAAAQQGFYLDEGACPFECCVYRDWTVKEDIVIRREMDRNSQIVFKVKKGEFVTAITGVVITTVPGKAIALKPIEFKGKISTRARCSTS